MDSRFRLLITAGFVVAALPGAAGVQCTDSDSDGFFEISEVQVYRIRSAMQ